MNVMHPREKKAQEYFDLANDQAAVDNHNKAIKCLDYAIRLDPDFAQAYNNRGISKDDLGDFEEAIKDFSYATKIDPEYAEAHYNRAISLVHAKRYEEAVKDFSRSIQLDPTDGHVYYNRGFAYEQMGRLEDAISDYDEAIDAMPKCQQAYYNRANVQETLGHREDALRDYDIAIKLNPNDKDAYYNRAVCYQAMGLKKEAKQDFQTVKDLEKGKLFDLPEGHALVDQAALSLNPSDGDAYSLRAVAKAILGQYGQAKEDYRHCIALARRDSIEEFKLLERRIFYKFAPLDMYTISNLMNKKLYFTPSRLLEDPFELPLFNSSTFLKDHVFVGDLQPHILSLVSHDGSDADFSSTINNPKLFEDYAQKHTGVCIEYELDEACIGENVFYAKAVYERNLMPPHLEYMFAIKHPRRSYEKEVRLVSFGQESLLPLKGKIRKIVFGINAPVKSKQILTQLLKSENIRFYEAKIKKGTYFDFAFEAMA